MGMPERQAVVLTPAAARLTLRDRIWTIMRSLREFTAMDVRGELVGGITHQAVRRYAVCLEAAGYLERIRGASPIRWRLVKDTGVDAPRVRPDGSAIGPHPREQMWRTMRIIGEFSVRELAISASTESVPVTVAAATQYIRRLERAGIVRRVLVDRSGDRYRLLKSRYTGPRPPVVRRDGTILDLNTGEILRPTGGGRHD